MALVLMAKSYSQLNCQNVCVHWELDLSKPGGYSYLLEKVQNKMDIIGENTIF